MKKTVLAVALSLAAGTASAAVIESQDFTVNGEIAVGGYYLENGDKLGGREYYNDGATGVDLEVKYEKNDFVGFAKYEFDLENDYGVSDADAEMTKFWVGYNTSIGLVSIGTDNDSALDKIDGYADQTVEFGLSASDASDVGDVIKLEGAKNELVYGISYYNDRNDKGHNAKVSGYNGYVGMRTEMFDFNVGFEKNEKDDLTSIKDLVESLPKDELAKALVEVEKIVLVNGVVKLNDLSIGALYSQEESYYGVKSDLISVSAAYKLDQLTLSSGYHIVSIDNVPVDAEYVNIGASYMINENLEAMVDVAIITTDEVSSENDTKAFAKLAYTF